MFAKFYQKIISNLGLQKRCSCCQSLYSCESEKIFGLCPSCAEELKPSFNYCPRCGIFPYTENVTCFNCSQKQILWSQLAVYGPYTGILRHLILQGEFYNNLIITQTLGQLLIPLALNLPIAEGIIPMPLHSKRLNTRGYNQCVEIAKPIGKALEIPIFQNALKRVVHSQPQSSLSKAARQTNLLKAFQGNSQYVEGKKLILLDDVSTTGSTLTYATKALLEAGATEIFVLILASTSKD